MFTQEIDLLKHRRMSKFVPTLWLFSVFLLALGEISVLGQVSSGTVTEVRTLYPSEWGVPYPAGVSYSLDHDHLFLLDKLSPDQAPTEETTVTVITPYEDLVSTVSLEFPVEDRINVTFDDSSDRLWLLSNGQAELAQIEVGEDGLLDPTTLTRVDIAPLELQNVQGMDVDVEGRRLFLLDSAASQIVSVDLDAEFGFVSSVDISHLNVPDLRGIAIHPVSRRLFVVSPSEQMLYELTQLGRLVNGYDLDSLALVDPQGLDFGPSADLTDPLDTIHLFIADSNLPDIQPAAATLYIPLLTQWTVGGVAIKDVDVSTQTQATPVFGRILEVALQPESNGAPVQTITAQVASSTDDAEEQQDSSGAIDLDSTDLELIRDGDTDQIVGIRFTDIMIPAGATIVNAHVEFDVDELDSVPTSLVFRGEASDHAAPFASISGNISGRSLTVAGVSWSDIPAWTVEHETHRTPDLSPIIQEIVDRDGWSSGNAIAFIVSGSGSRTAEAYDGESPHAPRLVVEYVGSMPTPVLTPAIPLTPTPNDTSVRFAVIGDYGNNSPNEARVAGLVDGWDPDFVITTGDNNYPDGEAATIDDNIGQYYSQFIGNYQGAYGSGSLTNRFWPSLGNHDWHTITCTGNNCSGAYFDYFTLPNNERYYETDLGLVHLFALDSDNDEPNGRAADSIQAGWLQERLTASTSCYNVVYFHHAAYSSGKHGSSETMQWPFATWGTDAVFSGHDHVYERLDVGGIPYFVNGAGGAGLYAFENLGTLPSEATSVVRYNEDYGAMLVTATSTDITYQFYNADGILIDDYAVTKNCTAFSGTLSATATVPAAPSAAPLALGAGLLYMTEER